MQKVDVKINNKILSYSSNTPLNRGDKVVIKVNGDLDIAVVDKTYDKGYENLEEIVRVATEKDLNEYKNNLERAKFALETTKRLVEKLKLDMNVVSAKYNFDGSKVVIDFVSENRVDFRELIKELVGIVKSRIELRQIGARDEAKMFGGIGVCGRVCCCTSFLKDFEKVSIKMAKVQGLALNPTKISGACGRLMCCLEYENPYYSEMYEKMPKLNSEIKTKEGVGTVIYTNALKGTVSVRFENKDGTVNIKDYKLEELQKKGK